VKKSRKSKKESKKKRRKSRKDRKKSCKSSSSSSDDDKKSRNSSARKSKDMVGNTAANGVSEVRDTSPIHGIPMPYIPPLPPRNSLLQLYADQGLSHSNGSGAGYESSNENNAAAAAAALMSIGRH